MAYTAWSVVFGEQPTAAKWNQLGANDAGFKDGTNIDNLAILTRHLNNGSVTADKLDLDPAENFLFTDENVTATSYSNLPTNQSVTIPVGANGMALVLWRCGIYNVAGQKHVSIAVSGASTVAASDNWAIRNDASGFTHTQSASKLFTGLTPGNNTFTLQARTSSGTARIFARGLIAIPL